MDAASLSHHLTVQLWEKALETLDPDLRKELEATKASRNEAEDQSLVNSILSLVEEKKMLCIAKRWKSKGENGRIIIIRDVLEKTATWINKFKVLGDQAVSYDPGHAALPWAEIRFVLQATINDVQIFGAMMDTIEKVSNIVARCAVLEYLYLHTSSSLSTQLESAMIRLYAATLEHLVAAKRYCSKHTHDRVLKSAFSTVQTAVSNTIAKIDMCNSTLNDITSLIESERNVKRQEQHVVQFEDIKQGISSLRNSHPSNDQMLDKEELINLLSDFDRPINRIVMTLEQLKDNQDAESRRTQTGTILKWLSTIPHPSHHRLASEGVLKGSTLWFLRTNEFMEWERSSSSSILWLHGIPGSGKSKIIASTIQYLQQQRASSSNSAPLAYFYCSRNTQERFRADPAIILRSILKQLSLVRGHIWDPVRNLYEKRELEEMAIGSSPSELTLDETTDLILELLDSNPATIVIDALDECDPSRRNDLLYALDRIIRDSSSLVRVLVSSRDDNDIVVRLENSPNIYIAAHNNFEDIKAFTVKELTTSILRRRMLSGNVSPRLRNTITTALLEGAQGMFRWVSLSIQRLEQMKHEQSLIRELRALPKELARLYEDIYTRIITGGREDVAIAKRILRWLLCSQRPLTTTEFVSAVCVDPNGCCRRLTFAQILDICCNFVVLDKEAQVFRFAHLSVREYLESRREYRSIVAHSEALDRCLANFIAKNVVTKRPCSHIPILDPYVSQYWVVHYQKTGSFHHKGKRGDQLKEFLLHHYHSWNYKGLDSRMRDMTKTPYFLACWLKDEHLLNMLRENGLMFDLKRFNFDIASCLHCVTGRQYLNSQGMITQASLEGKSPEESELLTRRHDVDLEFAQFIMNQGATVNATDWTGMTPLHWAVMGKDTAMVKWLLDHGADALLSQHTASPGRRDSVDKDTPLHVAARNGNVDIVELLLSVKPKQAASFSSLSLRDRLQFSHQTTSKVARRSLVLKNENGRTPLHEASLSGHIQVVEILLSQINKEEAFLLNWEDKRGYTPLRLAKIGQHVDVSDLLSKYQSELYINPSHDPPAILPVYDTELLIMGTSLVTTNTTHRGPTQES